MPGLYDIIIVLINKLNVFEFLLKLSVFRLINSRSKVSPYCIPPTDCEKIIALSQTDNRITLF